MDIESDNAFPLFSPSVVELPSRGFVAQNAEERLVLVMVEEGLVSVNDLDELPFGVALPIREALENCRQNPPAGWPVEAYELMRREDLATLFNLDATDSRDSNAASGGPLFALKFGSSDGKSQRIVEANTSASATAASQEKEAIQRDYGNEIDGTALMLKQSTLRFGRDKRVKEVCRILRSNRLIRMSIPPEEALSGGNEEGNSDKGNGGQSWKQIQLFLSILRTLALPIGRGMLTLGSYTPDLTEALPIPSMVLRGVLPPKGIQVSLDLEHPDILKRMLAVGGKNTLFEWPSFHNGVAAGLRVLIPDLGGNSADAASAAEITRTWVAYNRPRKLHSPHAGFLLGLGLRGHLSSLAPSDLFWYLSQDNDATIMAILLGMAAGKAGTTDVKVSKMLCLRVPALLPPAFADLSFSAITQTSALMGIGLLYRGTAHRLMTELLLTEIGNRPADEKWTDQGHEAYSLAAGLSLGLVCLQRGANAIGLADLQIQNRLRQYMDGGPSEPLSSMHGDGHHSAFRWGSGRHDPGGANGSRMKEGRMVNVDVTAPGAIAALGLMYMRTGNRAIAEYLRTPDTHFALDYVRPDFIMLRVMAQNLVMWNDVRPIRAWVFSQVPAVIGSNLSEGSCLSLFSEEKKKTEQNVHVKAVPMSSSDLDLEAIRQSFAYIIAGACLSLGFRFAGTANEKAQGVILHYLKQLLELRMAKSGGAGSLPKDLPRPSERQGLHRLIIGARVTVSRGVLEACIAATASALGMVMAGTGHLESLRMLRAARTLVDANASFGTHQVVHMAIGLLFLGGGQLTLGSTPEATASLVCAFFPRYSMHPGDNRYYLQALRHLYVLAVESRCIQCLEVNTGKSCYVPLELDIDDGPGRIQPPQKREPMDTEGWPKIWSPSAPPRWETKQNKGVSSVQVVAPCLLPPLQNVRMLRIASPRFWPISLNVQRDWNLLSTLHSKQLTLAVKTKAPKRPAAGEVSGSSETPGGSGTLGRFDKYFGSIGDRKIAQMCKSIAKEFDTERNINALSTHLCVCALVGNMDSMRNGDELWNFRLAYDYSIRDEAQKGTARETVLGLDFLGSLAVRVHAYFESAEFENFLTRHISSLMKDDQRAEGKVVPDGKGFPFYLSFYDFPGSAGLLKGLAKLKTILAPMGGRINQSNSHNLLMAAVTLAWPKTPVLAKVKLVKCLRPILTMS